MMASTSCSLKLETDRKAGSRATVDDFVAKKASNFNKVQQRSTSRQQRLQQESVRINKNP
jgi:hypothetical protein